MRRCFWVSLGKTCIATIAITTAIALAPLKPTCSVTSRYHWGNVALGGGGYVTGVYLHPLQRDLVYIKTDIGGFYRWNSVDHRWIPLTDQTFSQLNS